VGQKGQRGRGGMEVNGAMGGGGGAGCVGGGRRAGNGGRRKKMSRGLLRIVGPSRGAGGERKRSIGGE